ncbi:stage II sporulation protein P [Striga asiatica]|uniref:Stage II sporulation protein P n=1 Tax=Striga asiatica TaxID=4170 RepID=A0A5A7PI51_STRAF|nr:stage II sporulation protein P [Striga asiatica]
MNMKNPEGDKQEDSSDEISNPDNEIPYTITWPSGRLYGHDYFPGDDDYDYTKPSSNTTLSPLTIILESEETLEELSDMVHHLVNEHPELIPLAKQLLEALDCDCDENKPAQKAMELLKNEHVIQGFVKIYAEGYALPLDVNMLADEVLEGRTVADRVALIRRDPSLDACVSAKEDVDIMRGALCILVGYWIDQRLNTWFYEQSTNLCTCSMKKLLFPIDCCWQMSSDIQIRCRIRATNKMSQMGLAWLGCGCLIYAFCVV